MNRDTLTIASFVHSLQLGLQEVGTNFDSNGKLDKTQLKQNLEAAIDVCISAVNGSPCGGKPIHLLKGAQDELSKKYQES